MSENKVRAIEALNMWREGGSISTQCVLDIIIKTVKEEVPEWTFSAEIKPDEPQLIQGYTAEQWQEIIDGGYLCEVRDSEDEDWYEGLIKVVRRDSEGGVYGKQGFYNFCRPAQLKGVMRPIFVKPSKTDAICHFFSGGSGYLGTGKTDELFDGRATKYIEL